MAFGLDSAMIAERTGLPVVNCGLHAGLGLQFMLNQAAKYLKAGDIVVLSPEYGIAPQGEVYTLACATTVHPASLAYLSSWSERVRVACVQAQFAFKHVCRGCPTRSGAAPDPIYRRSGFNQHGDLVSHLAATGRRKVCSWNSESSGVIVEDDICAAVIAAMNSFAVRAREQGAHVYLIHPPLPQSLYKLNMSAYDAHGEKMHRELQFPVLSSPAEFVLADDTFFDTRSHLNRDGRKLRTELVIAKLLPLVHVQLASNP